MAFKHTGQAAGSAGAGGALFSCSTHGIHVRRADSQRGQSHRMFGSVSGAPRQKGHLSDRRMACPTALPAVRVAPSSSPRRMLRSPFAVATCRPSLSVHGSAQSPKGARSVPF